MLSKANPHFRNYKYFIIHKPYGVLSQFTDAEGRKTLKDIYNFPKDVYPVGRLDLDSEGLLILTNNKSLTDYLLNPKNEHEREYYVQVEAIPSEESLKILRSGLIIDGIKTKSAKVKLIDDPDFPQRVPPIRKRKTIPTCWLSIILTEGRNRQVRKMTAKIGHPTLRLIRVRIGNLILGHLKCGEVRELESNEVKLLRD